MIRKSKYVLRGEESNMMQSLDFPAELFPITLTKTVSPTIQKQEHLQPQKGNFLHINTEDTEITDVSEIH